MYADRTKVADRLAAEDTKIHELVTQDLITSNSDFERFLAEDDCEKISKLLAEGFDEPLLIMAILTQFPNREEKANENT
jgi:hypothetical protein